MIFLILPNTERSIIILVKIDEARNRKVHSLFTLLDETSNDRGKMKKRERERESHQFLN